ncbi:unnamed protein product [Lepeophtheirus salmonis]|uniref:Vesicle transport protein n=1 Tax=Lepeophtheirus salmonis TaxID=72036 RepID=A0A7R8H1H1_LEPSM|nr:unnamed protein product [Lepeophtheirus salmonis]CAF2811377.1 unnamed protein product [Lepeophtheirus salmonis]
MNLKADLDQYLSQNKRTHAGSSVLEKLKLPSLNLSSSPFGNIKSSDADSECLLEGSEEANKSSYNKDSCCLCAHLPTLNKKQRILGFGGSLCMGLLCFVLASLYFPILLLQSRKFALLFTLGSIFTLSSFSFLYGPWAHIQSLFLLPKKDSLLRPSIFLTLFGTLYAALGLQSTILTIIFAFVQVGALIWFVVSYIPGGQTGIEYLIMKASYGSKHWTPPKGHVDPGESILQTAILLKYNVKSHLDGIVRPKETIYFLGEMVPGEREVTLSEEHTDFKWVTLSTCSEYANFPDFILALTECEEFIKSLS